MNRPALYAAVGAAFLVSAIAAIALLFSDRHTPPPAIDVSTFDAAVDDKATATARREIQAVQRKFQDAVRRKDLPAVLALMTPDFEQVSLNGSRLNRKGAEAAMKQSWPYVQSVDKWTLELASLTVKDDTAIGVVRESLVSHIRKDGEAWTENNTGNSRNTWVRTPSGWKYKRMVELPVGEGTLGDTNYLSRDQWQKEGRSRLAAERREANKEKDQAAAVKTETAITKAEARRMLEKVYADFRSAVRRKDADAALKLLSDDYTAEYPAFNQPRMAVETSLRRELKAVESIPNWEQEIGAIAINGNVVTATITDRRTTIFRDAAGKRHRVAMSVSMRDTWVKTRSGWKNSRTEMITATQNLDGRQRKVF